MSDATILAAVSREGRRRPHSHSPLAATMEAAFEGLYATRPERLPYDRSLDIRAFVLKRDPGNFLVYSVLGLGSCVDEIADLGGLSRHYLNHRHEALFASGWDAAPVFVHGEERDSVARSLTVGGTFDGRHMHDRDFEAIPTPGHTSGATAYLWQNGGHRFLFTGDSVYLDNGEWVAAVLGSSDRRAYMESLDTLRHLDFDVLVPWAATRNRPYFAWTERRDAARRLGAIIDRLRRGEDR